MFTPLTRSLDKEICETMCVALKLCCYSPSSSSEQISQTTDVYSLFSFVLRVPRPGLPGVGTNVRTMGCHLQVTVSVRLVLRGSLQLGFEIDMTVWIWGDFHATPFLWLVCCLGQESMSRAP